MQQRDITYVDYNNIERTEPFFFNFSKAEIAELEMSKEGGLQQFIRKIVLTQNGPELFKLCKEFILMSYGEKSPDGKRFIKTKELRDSFEQTPAYSVLLMELMTGPDPAKAFSDFIEMCLPQDVVAQVRAMQK